MTSLETPFSIWTGGALAIRVSRRWSASVKHWRRRSKPSSNSRAAQKSAPNAPHYLRNSLQSPHNSRTKSLKSALSSLKRWRDKRLLSATSTKTCADNIGFLAGVCHRVSQGVPKGCHFLCLFTVTRVCTRVKIRGLK